MTHHRRLRIGLFTHSVNPRGGVVHCLELGEALAERGHEVTVHAPAEPGRTFFRPARRIKMVLVPSAPKPTGLASLVRQRVSEYTDYLSPRGEEFDIYHAHDGLSGSALAGLVDQGVISRFVRTVHHLDLFEDPFLQTAQDRSILSAASCLCVSKLWRDELQSRYGIRARIVNNGVDTHRYTPEPRADDEPLRMLLMSSGGCGPTFLAVGGVEKRKNTVNLLKAFLKVREELPRAVLLIAGGASLLDHSEYRAQFDELLVQAGPEIARSVVITGPMTEDQMPAAYRLADALVFPSVTEGFGLAVLEAMACGTPVVTSKVAPFTEYLRDRDALLVNPDDPDAIAAAMRRASEPEVRLRLRAAGLALSHRYPWSATATECESSYLNLLEAVTVRTRPSSSTATEPVRKTAVLTFNKPGGAHAGDAISGALA